MPCPGHAHFGQGVCLGIPSSLFGFSFFSCVKRTTRRWYFRLVPKMWFLLSGSLIVMRQVQANRKASLFWYLLKKISHAFSTSPVPEGWRVEGHNHVFNHTKTHVSIVPVTSQGPSSFFPGSLSERTLTNVFLDSVARITPLGIEEEEGRRRCNHPLLFSQQCA